MTYQAKIADDGQLVFPADFARALGLHPGDALTIDIREGEVEVDRMALIEQGFRNLMKNPRIAAEADAFEAWRREEARLEEEKWRRLGY